jgi:hypothetical protein
MKLKKKIAEDFIQKLNDSKKFDTPVAVKVIAFTNFYPAEDYHQEYYKKASLHYSLYKKGSGREAFIDENWTEEEKEAIAGKDAEFAKKYRKPDNATILQYSQWRVLPRNTTRGDRALHLIMLTGIIMRLVSMWMLWQASHSLVLVINMILGLAGQALIDLSILTLS